MVNNKVVKKSKRPIKYLYVIDGSTSSGIGLDRNISKIVSVPEHAELTDVWFNVYSHKNELIFRINSKYVIEVGYIDLFTREGM